jgi:GTP-binding protein HflX
VTTRQPDPAPGAEPERGFVLAAPAKGADAKGELAELRELARTAGVEPIGVARAAPRAARPAHVRRQRASSSSCRRLQAFGRRRSLIVDDELTPGAAARLEDALEARVVDRTQLILDIFASTRSAAEGKLQVELAQLEYNLPRHARAVAAPRAARRRRRHERPRARASSRPTAGSRGGG